MFDDDANAWMHSLDWLLYRKSRQGFLSQRLFLPRVVEMFGAGICAPWPQIEFFLGEAGNPPTEPIVDSDVAFHEDGSPVPAHHDRLTMPARRS